MLFAAAQETQATTETIKSVLPMLAVVFPLLGSLIVFVIGMYSEKLRNLCAVLTALVTFVLVFSLYPLVSRGAVEFQYAQIMQYGLLLRVDFFGFLFAALFATVWFLATAYSTVYMSHEHAQNRYYVFLLSTLGHCLGVVLAGDLFTLFLFFELMTFSSYVLVIHTETPEAMQAGAVTLYMGVAGGLCLLMGIFLIYHAVGTLDIRPMFEAIEHTALNPYVVIILFLVGFGIKAGMIPLHIWLPKAHPVAPSPASALLSGIMIKAGAYGIFRVVGMIFTPAHMTEELAHHAIASNEFGYYIIWIGIITMFLGAFMALLSTGAKKILAYSSVSQMGYILLGVGCAAYLGFHGPMGFAGAVYHIINHAFFKSGLFMMVGAIYLYTHDLEITRIRGMIKKAPVIAVFFLIAFAGVGGIPGFNGYVSKTLLHHAIVEAYEHHHVFSLLVAEKIFTLTSAMTLCYFTKLFTGLFLGPVPEKYEKKDFVFPPLVYAVLGIYGAVITGIGLFPNFLLDKMVVPAMAGFTYDAHAVEHLHELTVWTWSDLKAMVVVLAIAAVLYTLMTRLKFFEWKPPAWLSIEYLVYAPVVNVFLWACCKFVAGFDSGINRAYIKTGKGFVGACRVVGQLDTSLNEVYELSGGVARKIAEGTRQFDGALNEAYEKSGSMAKKLAVRTRQFDESLNEAYEKSGSLARRLAERTRQFDESLNEAYEKSGSAAKRLVDKTAELDDTLDGFYEQAGERSKSLLGKMQGRPSEWNIKNLNFDSLLMAILLGVFLFVLIYYTRNL